MSQPTSQGIKVAVDKGHIWYRCLGCKHSHSVPIQGTKAWTFNNNFILPTLNPSVRHYYTHPQTKQEKTICHYFIKDGKIEYCLDCKHELAGKTVEMESIE